MTSEDGQQHGVRSGAREGEAWVPPPKPTLSGRRVAVGAAALAAGVAVVALTGVWILFAPLMLFTEPDVPADSVSAEVTLADPSRDVAGLPDGSYLLTLVANEQATFDTIVEPNLRVSGSDGAAERVSVVISELADEDDVAGPDGQVGPLLEFGDHQRQLWVRETLDRCDPDGGCVRRFQMDVSGLDDLDDDGRVVVAAEQTFIPGQDSVPEGAGLLLTIDGGPDGGRHGRSSEGIGPAFVVVDDGDDPAGTTVQREWTMSLPRSQVPDGQIDGDQRGGGQLTATWEGAAVVGLLPDESAASVTVAASDGVPVPVIVDGERAAGARETHGYRSGPTRWQVPLTLEMVCDADVCETPLTLTVGTSGGGWVVAGWSNMVAGLRTADGQRLSGWTLRPTGA